MTDDRQAPGLDRAELDDLLRELLDRVHGVVDERERLRLLLDAVVALNGDLSLDGVLQRIVRTAARLVGARYVALGVLSRGPGKRLRTFVHHGVTEEVAAVIGELPHGHGLLGQIIDHPEPLRLHDIAAHPSSSGFPPGHPRMRSFLGVPVRARDRVFGNLYLCEKEDGFDFTARDEEVVLAVAAAAGVAIENATLYADARRREAWARATNEAMRLVDRPDPGAGWLPAVVRVAARTAGADGGCLVAAPDARPGSAAADSLAAGEVTRDVATGEMAIPVRIPEDRCVLLLTWNGSHAEALLEVDPALPAAFAEQVALAAEAARGRADRERLAVLEDRDRIGRDLHDLVIQRLYAVSLSLDNAARRSTDERLAGRAARAVDDLDQTIKDVRRTIFALATPEESADIQSAVSRMVDRAGETLAFRPTLTFEGPVRTLVDAALAADLLPVLGEALSNVSRHAEATAVQVDLSVGAELRLVVADDGRGLPEGVAESGLANMRERARRRGGTLEVDSGPGRGTRVVWSVPTPGTPT